MIVRVSHATKYTYTQAVSLAHNVAHLVPRPTPRQRTAGVRITIDPDPAILHDRVDYFGNPTTYFTVQEPHRTLSVTAEHTTAVEHYHPPPAGETPPWEAVRDRLRADRSAEVLDAFQFAFDSPFARAAAELRAYAAPSFPPGRPILDAARDLTRRVFADFEYDPKATTLSTATAEVFADRRGVCQDFAHLQIACVRGLGLAARYVSGYLLTRPRPGERRLVGADASHAWLSVFCGDAGWIDFDPTNDCIPSDSHVTLAWGRDYADVSPVKGVILGGGDHRVTVSVDVAPVESA